MRCTTDERYSESFRDQDRPNVSSVRSKRSAIARIIASECSLRGLGTRASHVAEIEVARFNEFPQALGCLGAKVGFALASSVAGLWGVEAYEPDVGVLVVSLDRVGINNLNVGGIDGLCVGWYGNE